MKTINDLFLKIRSLYNGLSDAEKKIADYLLHESINIYALPIAELSKLCDVSSSTWVRFCKSLGFNGLKEFKQALYLLDKNNYNNEFNNTSIEFSDLKSHKDTKQMIASIADYSINAIQSTLSLLDFETLEKVSDKIFSADAIKIFGFGASAVVAKDLTQKLLRIGLNPIFSDDLHIQLSYASSFSENDYAILISNSGNTKEIIEIYHKLCKFSNNILIITSYSRSTISKQKADFIYTSSPQLSRRAGAMSSRLAQLIIVDCLYTTIAHRHYLTVEKHLNESYISSLEHKS